jgi:hypothetical protein
MHQIAARQRQNAVERVAPDVLFQEENGCQPLGVQFAQIIVRGIDARTVHDEKLETALDRLEIAFDCFSQKGGAIPIQDNRADHAAI